MPEKNVIWLASYPKSGNTWFRIFITNLLGDSDQPASINDLKETSISSSRRIFDEYTGLSSADMTFEEIDRLRPDVYRMQSEESEELLFKKVHDRFYFVEPDQPLFPPEISRGCVYFMRNPLDVLVSFAYHSAKPVEKMVKIISDPGYAFCDRNDRQVNQLRQLLGSWSDHVNSWTEQSLIPVHVMRYEDMLSDPLTTFSQAVKFLGLGASLDKIVDALQKSDFHILTQQEKKSGFKEKMIKSKQFFRKGKVGDWRNHLSEKQVNKILSNHRGVMKKFGYLDEKDEIVF
ncbi:MAG: sulfotransferase domain-containing protein [Bacteroidales bacterium]|jgi:hypothetical protein|nr:sulfotransferase domain-containing protein [Bacteroidales bacterium]